MSHQSDWGYYKQPIKLPLVKFKISLQRPSLFCYKLNQVFLYWSYSIIADAVILWLTQYLVDRFQKIPQFDKSAEESPSMAYTNMSEISNETSLKNLGAFLSENPRLDS